MTDEPEVRVETLRRAEQVDSSLLTLVKEILAIEDRLPEEYQTPQLESVQTHSRS